MAIRFSRRAETLRASEVRELLKLVGRREVISFGGGLPPNECLPIAELSAAAERILREWGVEALQYSTTEGCAGLRRALAEHMRSRLGIDVPADALLITTGSQQAIDLTGRVFLDEGDEVFCESPTYLAAINAFRAFGPRFIEVPSDDEGMIVSELERLLVRAERPKFVYVIPDFQNPSGRTWSLQRRLELIELAARHALPVIEDCPYAPIRFEGESLPTLKALDRAGLVVFMSTVSKILCPGLRVGWVTAPERVLRKYVLSKQGCDLHTATFNQLLVAAYLETNALDRHLEEVRQTCRRRRDAMMAAIARELPPEVRHTRPLGGLFLWVELPDEVSARELLPRALAEGVAFPPGDAFFPNGGHANTLRLAFSDSPEPRIAEGIRRLGAAWRALTTGAEAQMPAAAAR